MTQVRCAYHHERAALGYCSTCGKPVCKACLVRLSDGNYCQACATAGDRPAQRKRRVPWWALALAVLGALALLRAVVH